jgi:CheY-like chemotaxis protein
VEAEGVPGDTAFVLLGDQPHAGGEDPLGFDRVARELADLILGSRGSTPFTLGIEAPWGMGKSTLMARLCEILAEGDGIRPVRFNAWTADDGEGRALEGLVKAVLEELDPGVLRRTLRNERLMRGLRAALSAVAGFFGFGNVVDTFWRQIESDPRARNDLRRLVAQAVAEWRGKHGGERLLCVFADDLDRCSPRGVLDVFEAMKLYLDVPGIVFVVGYDQDIVSELVLKEKGYSSAAIASRDYLEKFIQIVYRIPRSVSERSDALFKSLLEASGTADLFGPVERDVVVEGSESNPRRMKRFINGFVLAYGLDSRWRGFSPESLVRVQLLQMYFREFANLLERAPDRDPINEFLEYRGARDGLRKQEGDAAEKATKVLETFGLAGPGQSAGLDEFPALLKRVEENVPEIFGRLVRREDFLAIIERLGAAPDWPQLRAALAEGALASISESQSPGGGTLEAGEEVLGGLRILWVDDHHENNVALQQAILRGGAQLTAVGDTGQMNANLERQEWDALISDIDRDGNPEEGFDAIDARLKGKRPVPPLIFYASRVTAARKRRAAEVEAPLVDDPNRVLSLLAQSAGFRSALSALDEIPPYPVG